MLNKHKPKLGKELEDKYFEFHKRRFTNRRRFFLGYSVFYFACTIYILMLAVDITRQMNDIFSGLTTVYLAYVGAYYGAAAYENTRITPSQKYEEFERFNETMTDESGVG